MSGVAQGSAHVVFLSTYGVLTPWFSDGTSFDREACSRLADLCAASGARLILVRSKLLNEMHALEYGPPRDAPNVCAALDQCGVRLDGWLGWKRNISKVTAREVRRYIKHHRVKRWVWLGHEHDRPADGSGYRRPYPLDPTRYVSTTAELALDGTGAVYGTLLGPRHVEQAMGILGRPLPMDIQYGALCSALSGAEDRHEARFPFVRDSDPCCPDCKYGGDEGYASSVAHLQRLHAEVDRLIKLGACRAR